MKKPALLLTALAVFAAPGLALANQIDLSLEAELAQVERTDRMASRAYQKAREGLRYEAATLARERTELEAKMALAEAMVRTLIGQINVNGAPHNHLKRWAAQRRQRDAKALLEADLDAEFADLERREQLVAAELAQLTTKYNQLDLKRARQRAALLKQIKNQRATQIAGDSNRYTVFIGALSTPTKTSLLQQRRLATSTRQARREAELKQALKKAENNHYLKRSQPEVEVMLLNELKAEQDHQQALVWKQIDESLGNNLSFEELKRQYLNWLLETEQN